MWCVIDDRIFWGFNLIDWFVVWLEGLDIFVGWWVFYVDVDC